MSRLHPYRQRIPVHIMELIDVAKRITLFLVGQPGPLTFTFTDRRQLLFKTQIGNTLQCSCSNRDDHCMHTIYVLLKVFKISPYSPLIWQNAYLDSELTAIIQGKYKEEEKEDGSNGANREGRRNEVRNEMMVEDSLPEYSSIAAQLSTALRVSKPNRLDLLKETAIRLPLSAESVCPICQELMDEFKQPLSFCRVKCGNNFHISCLKIWGQHNAMVEHKITCPMCRGQFEESYLEALEKQQLCFRKTKSTLVFTCSSCTVPISTNPHKCLLCQRFVLCPSCYREKKHLKHPFITLNSALQWHGAEERRESELKIISYIQNKKKDEHHNNILSKIREIESNPSKLHDYLCSSFPYVSKYISQHIDPYKKMDFNMADMKCMQCGSVRMLHMRRLTCGHFVDHECLKRMIRNGKLHCLVDGVKILKGYGNLMELERQQGNNLSQAEDAQLDPQFGDAVISSKQDTPRTLPIEPSNQGNSHGEIRRVEQMRESNLEYQRQLNNIQEGQLVLGNPTRRFTTRIREFTRNTPRIIEDAPPFPEQAHQQTRIPRHRLEPFTHSVPSKDIRIRRATPPQMPKKYKGDSLLKVGRPVHGWDRK